MSEESEKVVVVREHDGKERRYQANDWSRTEDGGLIVLSTGDLDTREALAARYNEHAWLSVRYDGSSTGDPYFIQGKKLAIALDALRLITGDSCENDTAITLRILANEGLDAVAELDL